MKMFTQQMNLVSVTETLTSTRHLYTIIVVTPVISYTIPKPQKKQYRIDTHTHSFMYSTVIVMQHYNVHYNFYYCGCICTMYMIMYTCSSLRLSCCQPPHPSTLQVSLAGLEECRVPVWQDEDLSMTMLEL